MPAFSFKALSVDGKPLSGTIDADSPEDAISRLARQGHYPIAAHPAKAAPSPSDGASHPAARAPARRSRARSRKATRLGRSQLLVLTRELSHLTRSGIPIEQAVRTIGRTSRTPALRDAMKRIGDSLRAGRPFSDALEAYGAPFDSFYVAILRAGETAGALGDALGDLADHLKRSADFAGALRLALIYPAVLLATTVLSLTVILMVVVPQFETMFARAGSSLPVHTRMILGLSDLIVNYGWLIFAALCLAGAALLRALRHPPLTLRLHRIAMGLPFVGDVIARAEGARLCRSLGTSLRHGVPLTQAFDRILPIIRNRFIADRMEGVRVALRAGKGFAGPLGDAQVLPENAVQMIRVGEETGRLDTMLSEVGGMLEQDVQETTKQAMSLLEPAIIVTLGVVIGGIVLSIFLAIMASYDLAV